MSRVICYIFMQNFNQKMSLFQHPVSLFFSGVLLALSTVFPYLFFLLIALIPFIHLVTRKATIREVMYGGFVFGFGFFSAAYVWVWGLYPLEWIGIASPIVSFFLIASVWIFIALFFAVMMAMRAVLMSVFINAKYRSKFFIIPAIWVLFEYIGAVVFSLIWAGPGGIYGAHWSFGFLGYVLAEIPVLRSLSAVGGLYLLSFAAVFIVVLVYELVHREFSKERGSMLGAFSMLGVLFFGALLGFGMSFFTPGDETKEVALIHTTYFSNLEWISPDRFKERTENTLDRLQARVLTGARPDIVLFPEASSIMNSIDKDQVFNLMRFLGASKNTLILNPGNNNNSAGELISSVWYLRAREGIVEVRNKDFLVPVGEYATYASVYAAKIFGLSEWITQTYNIHTYTRVPKDDIPFKEKEVAVLQCSEIFSPILYRNLARDHGILANAASHAPLSSPRIMREQTLKMARIHAVANDRFFIQSGNVAPALVITNTGALQSILVTSTTGVLVDTVETRTSITLYTRFGDWFVGLLGLIVLFLYLRIRFARRKEVIFSGDLSRESKF